MTSQKVYDVSTSIDHFDEEFFAHEVCRCISKKGYCSIDLGVTGESLRSLQDDIKRLDLLARFKTPAAEIREGLLGERGSCRIAELALPDASQGDCTSLHGIDQEMSNMASALSPLTEWYLGFELQNRSRAVVHETGDGAISSPPVELKEGLAWMNTFEWHRLMALFFIGPVAGTLTMQPFDDEDALSHRVQTQPGMWLLLRADLLSHVYEAPEVSHVLTVWFLQSSTDAPRWRLKSKFPLVPVAKKLDELLAENMRVLQEQFEQDEFEQIVSRSVQHASNHMFHRGMQVAVRGMHCKHPGGGQDPQTYWQVSLSGSDCATKVPFARWDDRFDVHILDEGEEPRPSTRHGSFLDGIEFFDNKFFGISIAESATMDPTQRLILEVAYETFHSAGFSKNQLMRSFTGVYTGAGTPEWNQVHTTEGPLGATSGSLAITSNRISYLLGLNGPNFSMNTEGAGALLAISIASDTLQINRRQNDQAIALGADLMLAPANFARDIRAGLLSVHGRAMSFDDSADGYIRSDGVGGVFLSPLMKEIDGQRVLDEDQSLYGIISGTHSSNVGRTSTLGAPSAPADQTLIRDCVRKADINPLDVDYVETWGQGTHLHDAVEASALTRAYRYCETDEDQEMLSVGCVKGNLGNALTAAGTMQFIKVMVALSWGLMSPLLHLRLLNEHISFDESLTFCTDLSHFRMNSAFCGITAKGVLHLWFLVLLAGAAHGGCWPREVRLHRDLGRELLRTVPDPS